MKKDQETIRNLPADSFRGETVFRDLSPADKLRWLGEAASLVLTARKIRADRLSGKD